MKVLKKYTKPLGHFNGKHIRSDEEEKAKEELFSLSDIININQQSMEK